MRMPPAVAILFLTLTGCAMFRQDLPPWARPVPSAASPVAATLDDSASVTATPSPALPAPEPLTPIAPSPAVAVPLPASPAPARPAPPPPSTPPAAASVAAPAPASPTPAPPASATQSLPLTASLPPAEVRRLQDEAQRAIDDTERLLRQLDGRPLVPKDLETLRLAQGLVEQARKALGGQEYERAANLAAKARTLADDLSTHR
jgi:hypothetical protein